ncbi:tandem-95 repeat protein, partial [Thermodesulfobacteriota bacterium]
MSLPTSVRAEWEDLGLYGGQVYDIAIDLNDEAKWFAGTFYGGGLFITEDYGANWDPVLTGDEGAELDGEATFANTAVWGVEIAPSNSNVVWAVHNRWAEYSTDGGYNWNHIYNRDMQAPPPPYESNGQMRLCQSVAIDPGNYNRVYVGTSGAHGGFYDYGAIFRTTDGGATWTRSGPNTYSIQILDDNNNWVWVSMDNQFPLPVVDVEIDPTYPHVVWAIASKAGAGYLYRSNDYGGSWTLINSFSEGLTDVEVKPDDYNSVYVSGWNGVRRCYYSGGTPTWIYSSSGSDFRAITFQPGNPNILYAAGRGTYWGYYNISAASWLWRDIGYQLLSLAARPATTSTPHYVLGGELHRGVVRVSYTALKPPLYVWTTTLRNNGINAIQVHDLAVDQNDPGRDRYLVASEDGLYERASATSNWVKRGDFLYTAAYSVALDPDDSSNIYAGTEGRVYRTTDIEGGTWNSISVTGIVTDIAVSPSPYNYVYVTTRTLNSGAGYVYRMGKDLSGSTNIRPSSAADYDYNTVAINPSYPYNILVGGGSHFGSYPPTYGHIWESNSYGNSGTWYSRLSNVVVNSILIDPNNTNNMYAGCGYSGGTDIPLYKSTNGGTTWQRSYKGIPGAPSRYGIWGSSSSDIFVVRHSGSTPKGGEDDNYLIHYNGSNWEYKYNQVYTPLYSVWGSASNNVWVVGKSGKVARYNGSSWANWFTGASSDFDFHDIWGSASNNVFAVGTGPRIYRFNGSSWSSSLTTAQEDLHGVWGNSTSNFYAVGSFGTIMRFNGSSWYALTSPVTTRLEDIWGSSSTDIYAVGAPRSVGSTRYYTILRSTNGSSWSVMSTPSVPAGRSGILRAVWGASGYVYAVGDDGVVLRRIGSGAWSSISSSENAPLYGIWGSAYNNVYAVGLYGTIIRWNGSSWSSVDTVIDKVVNWNAVTDLGLSPEGNVYASTNRQGIFASGNGGLSWINMDAPPYTVYAVDAGSVVSGGDGGGFSLSGEGLLKGEVNDADLGGGLIDVAITTNAAGGPSTSTEWDGSWAMMHPAGYPFSVTATKPGYAPYTENNVPVYDGTWTMVTMDLSDPIVTVRMDGQEILAVNEVFVSTHGEIYPNPTSGCQTYGWTSGNDGRLMVPYTIGCIELMIVPDPGYGVLNVVVNGQSMGSITEYTFNNIHDAQTLAVTFEQTNQPPTDISLSSTSVYENQPQYTYIGTFDTSDPDPGDTHSYSFVSGSGDSGNSSFYISGRYLYTFDVFNYESQSSYSIRVQTSDGITSPYEEVFIINIFNQNETPTDISISSTIVNENLAPGTIVGVLSTADPDAGDSHTYSLVSGTGSGDNGYFYILSNQLRTNAWFNYEIDNSYSIRVRSQDVLGLYREEMYTINILNVNDPPLALPNNYNTDEDTSLFVAAPGVLNNDTDEDLDSLDAILNSGPAHASAFTLNLNGSFSYTPATNYNGPDSFSYHANDGSLNSGIVTVTIGIDDINDAPTAVNDITSTNEDTAAVINVLINDSDIDGTVDTTSVVVASGPSHGTTSVNGSTGAVTYTPTANYNGPDSFTYTFEDDDNAVSNQATVSITVDDINDVPTAVNDITSTDEDTAAEINVLANDSDIDGTVDVTSVVVTSGPSHGSTSVNGSTGAVTYTPLANYNGPDSFTYTFEDDDSAVSNQAT